MNPLMHPRDENHTGIGDYFSEVTVTFLIRLFGNYTQNSHGLTTSEMLIHFFCHHPQRLIQTDITIDTGYGPGV